MAAMCLLYRSPSCSDFRPRLFAGKWFLKSWSTENTFQSKKNLAWFSGKCFLENLGGKHFPEVVKNLEMSLFADYIKFDPQTFDCYI